MYNKTDQIYIMTKRVGYLHQLRMYGPIINPLKCPISICMSLLISGVELYQYDEKTKDVVALTLENLYDDKKFDKEPPVQVKQASTRGVKEDVSKGVSLKKEVPKMETENVPPIEEEDKIVTEKIVATPTTLSIMEEDNVEEEEEVEDDSTEESVEEEVEDDSTEESVEEEVEEKVVVKHNPSKPKKKKK